VPDVSHRGLLVLVHQLADPEQQHLTVLNFSAEPVSGTVRSVHLMPGSTVSDMFTSRTVATVDDLQSFSVDMEPHQGHSLLVQLPGHGGPAHDDVP
jgi:hypothetical protein